MSAWEQIDAFLESLGIRIGPPTSGQTTGGTHVPGSEHYAGRARDYGNADSDVSAITAALIPYAQGPNYIVDELFSSRDNVFFDKGVAITPSAELRQGHYDHVHVGIRPGATLPGEANPDMPAAPTTGATPVGVKLLPNTGDVKRLLIGGLVMAAGVALVVLGGWRGVKSTLEPKEVAA